MSDAYDYRKFDRLWHRELTALPPASGQQCPDVSRALLREELRHTAEILHLLEEALENRE